MIKKTSEEAILKSDMSQGLAEAKVEKVSCKLATICLSYTGHDNFISAKKKTLMYTLHYQDNSISRLR